MRFVLQLCVTHSPQHDGIFSTGEVNPPVDGSSRAFTGRQPRACRCSRPRAGPEQDRRGIGRRQQCPRLEPWLEHFMPTLDRIRRIGTRGKKVPAFANRSPSQPARRPTKRNHLLQPGARGPWPRATDRKIPANLSSLDEGALPGSRFMGMRPNSSTSSAFGLFCCLLLLISANTNGMRPDPDVHRASGEGTPRSWLRPP